MKIKKEDIQNALEIVKPGLASIEIIEQSTSFAFLGDRVVTYNDSISLSHPIKGLDLKGAIRAEELYEFLNKTKEDSVQIVVSDNELKLKCGKAKAGFRLQSEIVLPLQEVDEDKDWHELSNEFADNLMFVKDSASNDEQRAVLTCVHITNQYIEASDSLQIMRLYDEEFPFDNYLIPAKNIPEIAKINPVLVAETDGWIHFKNLEETEISCRVLMEEFPDTSDHFVVEGDKIVFPKKITEVLERAMVFTKKDHNADEQVDILLKGNKALIEGSNEYGWFKEQVKVKYKGESAKFSITPILLKNILTRSNTCILGSEKIRFEGEGWEYVAVLKNT